MSPVAPLAHTDLCRCCDPEELPFETTADLEDLDGFIGQDRAISAMQFGVSIDRHGYNIYALGPAGAGKYTLTHKFAEERAALEPVPYDWCYVNNFDQPYMPRALRLPAGKGRQLRSDMNNLIRELRRALSAAFESEEYQARRQGLEAEFQERQQESLMELQEHAKARGLAMLRTQSGLVFAPMEEGSVIEPEAFEALDEEEKQRIQSEIEVMQEQLQKMLYQVPRWEREFRKRLAELNQDVSRFVINDLLDELQENYADLPDVLTYFDAVMADVRENLGQFLSGGRVDGNQEGDGPHAPAVAAGQPGQPGLRKYEVNLLVEGDGGDGATVEISGDHDTGEPHEDDTGEDDTGDDKSAGHDGRDDGNGGVRAETPAAERSGAPVIYESNPSYQNLIGRVEQMAQMGALVTDFTLIKPGVLHRANGGYLILDAIKVLTSPYAWEGLKRALQFREIRIESPMQMLSLTSTVSLEPEPIPLNVKVILMGDRRIYYLLAAYDPDFAELFKVAADFDDQIERDDENQALYARLIASIARKEELRHFDRSAVARVIDQSARLVADSERLSTHMQAIVDLLEEADHWAGEAGADLITEKHVQQAIDAQIYRSDRMRARMQEEILRDTIMIDTAGAVVGQINGLAVLGLGNFAFGKASRITATVRMGRGEVVDIEREVALSGPLHAKGVLILSSYLRAKYAAERQLSLGASLVFEQSYGGVDGDSASSTELYALLSAIARVPIKQSLAVTGSVNQLGEVQAIGGVNEKIEGFFDLCAARGLTGDQGVLIPAANVKHLMLRADVVAAVEAGRFAVYPIATIDQGIEVLTGLPAGEAVPNPEADESDDVDAFIYPEGTVNRMVADRLAELAHKAERRSRSERERDESEKEKSKPPIDPGDDEPDDVPGDLPDDLPGDLPDDLPGDVPDEPPADGGSPEGRKRI